MAVVNKNFVIKNGLEVDTNALFVDAVNNRVGINTDGSSGWTTDIFRNIDGPGNNLRLANISSGTLSYSILGIAAGNAAAFLFLNSQNRSTDGGTSTATLRNDSGDLRLQAMGSVGLHVQQTSGNVGIGTANPTSRLHLGNSDTTDLAYLRVGNIAGTNRYYRFIAFPAKATASGVADTAKSVYIGRLYNGVNKLTCYVGGSNNEEGLEIHVHRSWGTSSVPMIIYHAGHKVVGGGKNLSFHYQSVDNDSYFLFASFLYNPAVPINTVNDLRIDITSISSIGTFSVGTTPTIPTLNSSNQLNYGLYIGPDGRVGVGNNTNPQFAFDGFGILRMSSSSSFESQIISRNDANDNTGSYLILEKSRSGGAVQNGDPLGTLIWRGIDTNNTIQNSFAGITARAEGTIGAGTIPAGLYLTASSKFVFDINGEKLRIDNNGNLGIGTTNPRGRLDVVSSNSYNSDSLVIGAGNISYPTSQWSGWGGIVVKGTTSDARMFFQDGNGRINSYWNAYTDVGGYKYIVSGEPAVREQMHVAGTTGGYWALFGAPAGTAGGALTWTQTAYVESGTSGVSGSVWFSPRGTSSDFYITNSGSIGIGTVNPNRQLQISASGESNIVLENMSAGTDLKKSRIYHDTSNDFRISFINDAFTNENYILWAKRGTGFTIAQTLLNPAGGNVGIGTTNAIQRLHVAGGGGLITNVGGTSFLEIGEGQTSNQFAYLDLVGDTTYTDFGLRIIRGNSGANTTSQITHRGLGELQFIANETAPIGFYIGGTADADNRVKITSTGNVGIGFTNPTTKLDVSGNSRIGGAASRSQNGLTVGFTRSIAFAANSDVDDSNRTISLVNESTTLNAMAVLGFRVNPDTASTNAMLDIKFVQTGATNTSALHYTFNHGGTFSDRFTILSSGNVGIGSISPSVKLDIGGETTQYPYSLRIRNTSHATSRRAAIAFGNGASHQILIDTTGNGTEDFSIYQANINRSPFRMDAVTGNICIGKGSNNAPTELAVNGYISESTDGGATFHNVVTQQDIGFNPNQIPLNQYLGQLAFMDEYSPTEIYNPSNTTAQLTIASTQTSGYAFIQLGKSATATNNFHFGSEGNGFFNFWNGNWGSGAGPRFTISSGGLVGINSSGPTGSLDIGNSGPQWSAFNYGTNLLIKGSRNNGLGILDNNGSNPWWIGNAGGDLMFAQMPALGDITTAANIRMEIAASGNVGIGTTNPIHKLTNYANVDGTLHTLTQNASTGANSYAAIHINAGTSNAYYFINSENRSADGGTRTATLRNDAGDLRLQASGSAGIIIKTVTGNVGIDTANPTYKLQVNGSFAATTKSFVIDHPTKSGFKLRYGSLEGPENGVYIRGKLSGNNTIELPEYWTELVDEDSITVNLTPIGRSPGVHSVIDIVDNTIVIESTNDIINCFFTVFAERKDVDKLITEYES